MSYVLMVFYLGTAISMHDFNDAAACNNARNVTLQASAGLQGIKAFCVPKGSTAPDTTQQQ